MKKFLICFFAIFLLGTATFAEDYDFRNTRWGMSPGEVKRAEKSNLISQERERLYYDTEINGMNFVLAYTFADNKLIEACYLSNFQHFNSNSFIDDFYNLKDLFDKKYGKFAGEVEHWNGDGGDYDKGDLVSMGYLSYLALWETSSTEISLMLNGDNLKTNMFIYYQSKKYHYESEQREQQRKLENI